MKTWIVMWVLHTLVNVPCNNGGERTDVYGRAIHDTTLVSCAEISRDQYTKVFDSEEEAKKFVAAGPPACEELHGPDLGNCAEWTVLHGDVRFHHREEPLHFSGPRRHAKLD